VVALELGDTCVELLEEEDLDEPAALQDRLRCAVANRHHRQVILDLSRLRRITSAIVAVLTGAEARGVKCGTPVAFACARRRVRRVLSGMHKLLTVHGSMGRALEAIAERGTRACHRVRRGGLEKEQRKETAMEGERAEDERAGPDAPRPDRPEAPAGERSELAPGQGRAEGQEEGKEEGKEQGKEEREPEAKAEADIPAPPREVPESVMQHLRERAPELADALPQKAEPAGFGLPAGVPGPSDPPEPEVAAPAEADVAHETVAAEVPSEPPPAPPEPVVGKKKPRKKKTARKKKSAGKKRRTKRKKKAAKKSSKGRKKARG
jgi:anti-anti-sigma regulatory factor